MRRVAPMRLVALPKPQKDTVADGGARDANWLSKQFLVRVGIIRTHQLL